MLLAPSMTRRSFLSGLYGDSLIWVAMMSFTASNSASKRGFHENFDAPAVAFRRLGILSGNEGNQVCKLASIPQNTCTSRLQVGFFSSVNAFIRFDLGPMNMTSSFLTVSAEMVVPPNSTSSLMTNFVGFSLRFLLWQNLGDLSTSSQFHPTWSRRSTSRRSS